MPFNEQPHENDCQRDRSRRKERTREGIKGAKGSERVGGGREKRTWTEMAQRSERGAKWRGENRVMEVKKDEKET